MSYSDQYEPSYTDLCGIMEGCREAITLLHSAGSDDTYRTLIAATRTAIYSSNDRTGNWRILADGLGGGFKEESCDTCSSRRFRAAQLGNYILFTNNFDPVLAWKFGDPPTGLDQWSAQYVDELLVIGISKARVITTFNGFMLVGNVELEGQHRSARVYWSDYNAPLSWIPSDLSLASYHEFGSGEKVLRMEQLGRFLMVYTDKSIYQGTFVGGDILFQFNTIPTDNPLVYEHSLINTGNAHIYGSHNGIYVVTSSDPRPVRYEWIHKADAAIYVGIDAATLGGFEGLSPFGPINKEQCEQFVGGYNELTEELWFSWPTDDNACPNMSLVLNLRYSAADLVDHGFTAFVNYKPDYRPSIRDWLNSECVCPVVASDFVKEGLPIDDQYCYTEEPMNLYYTLDGSEPTALSTPLTAPVTVEPGQQFRFIAINGAASALGEADVDGVDELVFTDNHISSDGFTNDLINMPDLKEVNFGRVSEISSTTLNNPSHLIISQDSGLEVVNLTALLLINNGALEISDNPVIESVNIPILTAVSGAFDDSELQIEINPMLAEIDLSSLATIGDRCIVSISANDALTDLDLSSLALLEDRAELTITSHPLLTTIPMDAGLVFTNTHNIDMNGNALSESMVDFILARAVAAAGFVTGSIDLSGGTNAPPSVAGAADAATLSGRGVVVTTN